MTEKISVIMGIYNCADTLKEAVKSIENQTYENWELILCDDGSKDGTYQIAEELKNQDSRIILLKNEKNLGLNKTLNRCLASATGDYIARMDGDDDCRSDRFEKQIAFLQTNPEYQIVSSSMVLFDESGEWGTVSCPEFPKAKDTVERTAFCHAAVMVKKECMDKVGGYTEDDRMLRVEDVNLWIKLYAAGFKGYNIQEPLYRMRNDQNALNRRKYKYRINSVYVRLKGCKALKLGVKSYIKAVTPMINGLVPAKLRHFIRKIQRQK